MSSVAPKDVCDLLVYGAYLLTVDAERGVLLRTEARQARLAYRIVEMDEVSFDEDFGPEVFEIHPPEGQD